MSGFQSRRPGFTLIEMMVAMAIVAVLVAILVPAVQYAREASRRNDCKNHLRQLGLALHNYHDMTGSTFPPGYIDGVSGAAPAYSSGFGRDNFLGWGWMSMILPQLDQGALYHDLGQSGTTPNFGAGLLSVLSGPMTPQTVQTTIPLFRCPSDIGSALAPSIVAANDLTRRYSFGRSNYIGISGTDPVWVNEAVGGSSTSLGDVVGNYRVNVGVLGAFLVRQGAIDTATVTTDAYGGTFGSNSKRGFRDMLDGSTNVIVVGERYSPEPFPWFAISMGEANWVGIPDDLSSQSHGQVLGEASVPINAFLNAPTPRPPTTGFGSLHAGGCHFLMGDGSVRFISQNVDLTTYRQLSRIADGAVVGNF